MEGVAHELQLLEQLRPELVGALAGVPGHMRWGCSLGRTGLQPGAHGVAAWGARGCSLGRTGLQPGAHGVAASHGAVQIAALQPGSPPRQQLGAVVPRRVVGEVGVDLVRGELELRLCRHLGDHRDLQRITAAACTHKAHTPGVPRARASAGSGGSERPEPAAATGLCRPEWQRLWRCTV